MNITADGAGNTSWRLIDELCDRFERAKRTGEGLSISALVEEVESAEDRQLLIRELIQLDLELQSGAGKTVDLEAYIRQLPEHETLVRRCYDRFHNRSRTRGGSSRQPRIEAGRKFGSYTIVGQIGEGGMGHVYEARHEKMDRRVALKVLSPRLMESADAVARFHREIKAAAKLHHPHIVTAFDAGDQDGLHYLVMEFVKGKDLSSYVKSRGPLSVKQALKCLSQAAKGLAYAHQQNIIHRDIKPSNLLVDRKGTVKVLDLGLARFESESDDHQVSQLTDTGMVMGTVDYIAPEQSLDTRMADARSDIYSLGCTLWYLLTGASVYRGDTIMKKLLAHRESDIPSLSARAKKVPRAVDHLFRKMVAKQPDDRFQSMNEVIDAIQSCLQQRKPGSTSAELSMAADPALADFLEQSNQPVQAQLDSESIASPYEPTHIAPAASRQGRGRRARKESASPRRSGLPKWLYGVGVGGGVLVAVAVLLVVRGFDSDGTSQSAQTGPVQLREVNWLPTDAQESPADLLATGEWEWRVEKNLGPVINTERNDQAADISADGLTLVLASAEGSWFDQDLWIAERKSRDAEWSTPVRLNDAINTRDSLSHPTLTPDGSGILFSRKHESNRAQWIFFSRRNLTNGDWEPPEEYLVDSKNSAVSADITADGRTLIFNTSRDTNKKDLLWARRESPSDHWSEPVPFGEMINTSSDEFTGTISNDRRMLIFQRGTSATDSQGIARADLWMTLRASEDDDWSEPVPLRGVNSVSSDGKPRLLADGKTFLFSSDRPGGMGRTDIWEARLVPKSQPLKTDAGLPFGEVTEDLANAMTLEFDDPTDHIRFPGFPQKMAGPFTIECWFQPHDSNTEGRLFQISGLMLNKKPSYPGWVPWMFTSDTEAILQSPLQQSGDTELQHLAVVVDNNTLQFFLNGTPQGPLQYHRDRGQAGDTPVTTDQLPETFEIYSRWNIGLDVGPQYADHEDMLPGNLVELRVSDNVRYEGQFTPENRFTSDENTVALYHFNEGSGTRLTDYSGNHYDGVIEGAEWVRMGEKENTQVEAPWATEREVAEWVIEQGGKVSVHTVQGSVKLNIRNTSELPDEPFLLRDVYLQDNEQVRTSDLNRLAQLQALNSLELNDSLIHEEILQVLDQSGRLTRLCINKCAIKSSHLGKFPHLKNLFTLQIGSPQIDEGWSFLSRAPRLQSLHLYGAGTEDLNALASHPQLL